MTNNEETIQGETTARVFPLPGTMHYNMVVDEKSQKNYYKWFKRINRVVVPLYKLRLLPLFGFGRMFMLLTTKGRKSGKKRTVPIGLFRINGILHVISGWGEKANWYKNMIAYPDDVYVQVGFRKFHARTEVVEGFDEYKKIMKWFVMNRPRDAKSMGWDYDRDDPETADFSLMIKLSRIVRFHRRM